MWPRKRILLVDLDELVLIQLQKVLEDAGFDTTTTWELREARELLRSCPFDMLLVGDHPPEIPAGDLLKQVRDTHSGIQCMVLQSAAPAAHDYFRSLGALAVVAKHRHHEIVQLIKNQLGGRAMAAAA